MLSAVLLAIAGIFELYGVFHPQREDTLSETTRFIFQTHTTIDTGYGLLLAAFMVMGVGIGLTMSPMSTAAMNAGPMRPQAPALVTVVIVFITGAKPNTSGIT